MTENNTNKKLDIKKIANEMLFYVKSKQREVLIRRLGLDGKEPRSLEKIGKSFSLTRERIRQIEKDGLKRLKKSEEAKKMAESFIEKVLSQISENGGIESVEDLEKELINFNDIASKAALKIVAYSTDLIEVKKNNIHKNLWIEPNKKQSLPQIDTVLKSVETILQEKNKTLKSDELLELVKQEKAYAGLDNQFLKGIFTVGQDIIQVGTNSFGLTIWRDINPKTIHDWTYFIVKEYSKPIHFTKIAELISQKLKSNKKVNVKTIHNVLISDKRFVLVGNGLYALKEWGYKEGTVSDVIEQILSDAKRPLTTKEIIENVMKQRIVKKNTIHINLQNKPQFVRVKKATYVLGKRK